MMTQSKKMLESLMERVIPPLTEQGFVGEYPHYRRDLGDRIELLGFLDHKYGVGFNVEISVIFPKRPKDQSNYIMHDFESPEKATVFSTRKRYRLPGLFDGWFYFTDVYKTTKQVSKTHTLESYEPISEQRSKSFIPGVNQTQVQAADDGLYSLVADEVNRQLEDAHVWWKKYDTPARLKKAK